MADPCDIDTHKGMQHSCRRTSDLRNLLTWLGNLGLPAVIDRSAATHL